ncbi:hypothetical protein MRX96_041258 [Rhipicephalus microplus]
MRLYSDWLKVIACEGQDKWIAAKRLLEYHILLEEMMEFVWRRMHPSILSVKLDSRSECTVTILSNVNLTSHIRDTLEKRVKFCFEPSTRCSELLAMVQSVGAHAPNQIKEPAEVSRTLIPPVGCSDQTRIIFRVWPVPFGWARQSSRYLCPVAVVSNVPRGFASWFLPLPCLLENASCKKTHHHRLPSLQSV